MNLDERGPFHSRSTAARHGFGWRPWRWYLSFIELYEFLCLPLLTTKAWPIQRNLFIFGGQQRSKAPTPVPPNRNEGKEDNWSPNGMQFQSPWGLQKAFGDFGHIYQRLRLQRGGSRDRIEPFQVLVVANIIFVPLSSLIQSWVCWYWCVFWPLSNLQPADGVFLQCLKFWNRFCCRNTEAAQTIGHLSFEEFHACLHKLS